MTRTKRPFEATPEAWRDVAARVKARRNDLGLTQAEAADDAGISDQVWSLIERAAQTVYRRGTLERVEAALGWGAGSIETITRGGEPYDLPVSPPGVRTVLTSEDLVELRAGLSDLQYATRTVVGLTGAVTFRSGPPDAVDFFAVGVRWEPGGPVLIELATPTPVDENAPVGLSVTLPTEADPSWVGEQLRRTADAIDPKETR